MKSYKAIKEFIRKSYPGMVVTGGGIENGISGLLSNEPIYVRVPARGKSCPISRGSLNDWNSMVGEINRTLLMDSDIKSHHFTTPYEIAIAEVDSDLLYFTVEVVFNKKL